MAGLAFSDSRWKRFLSSGEGGRDAVLWTAVLVVILVGVFLLNPWQRWVVSNTLPPSFLSGNPIQGGQLFSSLGCATCHSLHGIGPTIGPDLGKTPSTSWNPVRIVAEMWNHSPQMWEKMQEAQLGLPRVSETDMLDLLAYLYLIRYTDEPGNLEKGHVAFIAKHCVDCHSLSGASGSVGPDLSLLGGDTPIAWAQRMWNHRGTMQATMAQENIAWPTFQGREMVDLLTFIQENSSGRYPEARLLPADPANGKTLFREKGCSYCHAINGQGAKVGPDLGSIRRIPPTITQFAGLMWNHSPQMLARMNLKDVARTQFAEREMADLIAYLYVVQYLEQVGRADLGKGIFDRKHCASCHGADGRGGPGGPDLSRRPRYISSQMAYTIWTHGPQMYRKMRDQNIAWPTLEEQELVDLMAFLSSL